MQVGFDLTDIQLDMKYLETSVSKRITWMHGNLCVGRYSAKYAVAFY